MANTETWRNVGRGKIGVVKFDNRGNLKHEIISGGKTVVLTKEDREANHDRAADETLDPFRNGMMVPVRLLDGDESEFDLAAHPALLTDDDIKALVKENWRAFDKKLVEINNAITLSRILDLAEEENATVRVVKSVKAKLAEIDPSYLPIGEGEVTHLGHIDKHPDERRFGPEGEYEPIAVTPR